ncbi:hypothetical protein ACMFMG_004195 [Clarireedia jacksonii]
MHFLSILLVLVVAISAAPLDANMKPTDLMAKRSPTVPTNIEAINPVPKRNFTKILNTRVTDDLLKTVEDTLYKAVSSLDILHKRLLDDVLSTEATETVKDLVEGVMNVLRTRSLTEISHDDVSDDLLDTVEDFAEEVTDVLWERGIAGDLDKFQELMAKHHFDDITRTECGYG